MMLVERKIIPKQKPTTMIFHKIILQNFDEKFDLKAGKV